MIKNIVLQSGIVMIILGGIVITGSLIFQRFMDLLILSVFFPNRDRLLTMEPLLFLLLFERIFPLILILMGLLLVFLSYRCRVAAG
jgi:hypothetical protein